MRATELIEALEGELGTTSQSELAGVLGIAPATLARWKSQDEDLSARQVASALSKSRVAAVARSQLDTIKPVVEFYPIHRTLTKSEYNWVVYDTSEKASTYAQGLTEALSQSHGVYIFYDSRGCALYVGKAREQTLWKEINLAFNRHRDVQNITLVKHPERNQAFSPGHEKLRQPKETNVELADVAHYFSAYQIDDGMIDDLEALLVRGFANDLLNVRMETFAHSRA